MELITGLNDNGRRLDRILRKALADHPLSLIYRLLREGQVLVDGKPAKGQERINSGVKISIPSLNDVQKPKLPPAHSHKLPPPEIIWEGPGLIAVNKPAGLTVHGPDSLDTIVQSYLTDKLTHSLSFKPGPLHRLDKPSSGIVVFSTSLEGARLFTSLMKELSESQDSSAPKVRKTYLAIVEGSLNNEEIWKDELIRDKEKKKTFVTERCDSEIGKTAVTKVTPLETKGGYSLIQAEITTGRTHQIRVQAAAHGYPLLGDVKYKEQRIEQKGNKVDFFLHAWKLEFLEYSIEAPLPEVFKDKIEALFG